VIITIIGGIFAAAPGANIKAAVMNVNEPETRGVAFALQVTTLDFALAIVWYGPTISHDDHHITLPSEAFCYWPEGGVACF
jgi:hypothetical protein